MSRGSRPARRDDDRHVADLRIRASNLGWMLQQDRLDEAEQAIADIRKTLGYLDVAIHGRRRERAA